MNKEDLYPLIGKYLNGYEIVKVEEDPFVKGQINLWTSEQMTGYFGDKRIVKFIIRPDGNSSKIYQELVDKEIYQLKNNWKNLKGFLEQNCKDTQDIWLVKIINKMREIENKE